MANPTVCMSSPIFLMDLRFFWIRPTTKLQPLSPSSGSSSSSSSRITNWGFVQNVSAGLINQTVEMKLHWTFLPIRQGNSLGKFLQPPAVDPLLQLPSNLDRAHLETESSLRASGVRLQISSRE